VLKWAILASPQETSTLLIDKGKRDAASWFKATGLEQVVLEELEQKKEEQGKEGLVLPVGSKAGEGGAEGPAEAAAEAGVRLEGDKPEVRNKWVDDRDRGEEAEKVREKLHLNFEGDAGTHGGAAADGKEEAAGAEADRAREVVGAVAERHGRKGEVAAAATAAEVAEKKGKQASGE
jgi:hypothetical protein